MGPFAKNTLSLMAATLEALGSIGVTMTKSGARGLKGDSSSSSGSATEESSDARDNIRARRANKDFGTTKH